MTRNSSLFDNTSKKTSGEYKYPSSSAKYMQGYSSDAQKKGDKRFLSTKLVTPVISALDYSRQEDRRLSAQDQFSFDSVKKEDLSVDKMQEAEEDKEAYELGTELQYMTIDEEFEMAETDLDLSFLNSHCDKDDVFTCDVLMY